MRMQITTTNIINDKDLQADIDVPNICPRCNNGMSPTVICCHHIDDRSDPSCLKGIATFLCTSCHEFFIIEYLFTSEYKSYVGILTNKFPYANTTSKFPEEFNEKYPKFIEIYNQAQSAQDKGLTEISGMGFRKALEFLVKKYCIDGNQGEEESISKLSLSQCINKYIEDNKMNNLAKVATYLGNDETHYIRKYESYDQDKLKMFIRAMVNYIESELIHNDAQSFINEVKGSNSNK